MGKGEATEGKEKTIRTIFPSSIGNTLWFNLQHILTFLVQPPASAAFCPPQSHTPYQDTMDCHHLQPPHKYFLHTKHILMGIMSCLVLFGMLWIHEWPMCFSPLFEFTHHYWERTFNYSMRKAPPFIGCATQLRRFALAHKHKLCTVRFYQGSDISPREQKANGFQSLRILWISLCLSLQDIPGKYTWEWILFLHSNSINLMVFLLWSWLRNQQLRFGPDELWK